MLAMISNAAGNLTADGTYSYTWDAEGRNVSAIQSGTTVTTNFYDPFGRAAETYYPAYTEHVEHIYDLGGNMIGAYNKEGAGWWYTDVFMGARKIATYYSYVSDTVFKHPNNIGSTGLTTDHAGNAFGEALYDPWGNLLATTNNWGYDPQFAEFQAYKGFLMTTPNRSYLPNYGRWLSPNPLAGDITNPQSLNRYAYVMNNPTTLSDPWGITLAAQRYAALQPGLGSVGASGPGAGNTIGGTMSGGGRGGGLCPGCTQAAKGKQNQNGLGVPPILGFTTTLAAFNMEPNWSPNPVTIVAQDQLDQAAQLDVNQIAQAIMDGRASAAPVYPSQPVNLAGQYGTPDAAGAWGLAYNNFLYLTASINPPTILVEQSAACYEGNEAACPDGGEAAFQALMSGPWGGGGAAMGWGAAAYPGCWVIGDICRPTW